MTVLTIVCMFCKKAMGEKEGRGVEGVTASICEECWAERFPGVPYPREGDKIRERSGRSMTISKQCELLAGDYLFLRDKVKQFQEDSLRVENKEQIRNLGLQFLLTYLRPPGSDIVYPNISKETLRSVEERVRMALDQPTLDMIRQDLAFPVAELQDEMFQKVVACECKK